MAFLIWLFVYIACGEPNIFNNNGHDAGWIVTGIFFLIWPLYGELGRREKRFEQEQTDRNKAAGRIGGVR